jgi:hypothetical protein
VHPSKALTQLTGRTSPSSGSSCLLVPGGIFSQQTTGNKGGDKSPSLQSQQTSPQEMLQESQAEIWDTEAVSRKQHFILLAQTQRTCVQRLSPKNKEVSPYIPLQAGYRSKTQGLIHIWLLCNSIGYFTLMLHDHLPLVLCDLLHI